MAGDEKASEKLMRGENTSILLVKFSHQSWCGGIEAACFSSSLESDRENEKQFLTGWSSTCLEEKVEQIAYNKIHPKPSLEFKMK